jgi:hypothetical protein
LWCAIATDAWPRVPSTGIFAKEAADSQSPASSRCTLQFCTAKEIEFDCRSYYYPAINK